MDPNGGRLTYTLGGADAGLFKVDQDNIDTDDMADEGGQIRVGAGTKLDKETRDTYMVTVTATDSYGLSATTMVTIMVADVDEAPEIMEGGLVVRGQSSVNYAENGMGSVATYTASGPDARHGCLVARVATTPATSCISWRVCSPSGARPTTRTRWTRTGTTSTW